MAGWDLEDPGYLAMIDNNRVFFECLLEQMGEDEMILKVTSIQVMTERKTEGLEDRTWEEALAPR